MKQLRLLGMVCLVLLIAVAGNRRPLVCISHIRFPLRWMVLSSYALHAVCFCRYTLLLPDKLLGLNQFHLWIALGIPTQGYSSLLVIIRSPVQHHFL